MVSLSEIKFTDYHIALQNLAYLHMQDSIVNNHHIHRSLYWKEVLKDFNFLQRKFLKLYTNNADVFSLRYMCRWCRQYSNKLLVYLSHSHAFHEWYRSACWVIRRTAFNVYICSNHNSRYKHNTWKVSWKIKTSKVSFSKFRQFSYLNVFRERRECLNCSFC